LTAQPSATAQVQVDGASYPVEVARHSGFEAMPWSQVPTDLVSGTFQREGIATGSMAGKTLELRIGSPFGRHGESVFQLRNPPYREAGEIWVPLELFTEGLVSAEPIEGPTTTDVQETAASSPVAVADPRPTPDYRRPGPWRVVIDPGHGGYEPGTVSPRTGVREKDITLAVARKLADELRSRGLEPLLTRERDVFVKVMDRPSMAVDMDADVFISIHVDAQPGRGTSARGFTTFYLGRARTDDALQVALRENAVIEMEEGSEPPNMAQLEIILATMDRDAYRSESKLLAGHIQNGLRGALDTRDRGAKPGPYYVLLTPGLRPAVLVELGFITNNGDERKLTDGGTQDRIARSLADTIEEYLDDSGRRIETMEGRG
jgi:N-acetylmuramoyl-L-alanine amidase